MAERRGARQKDDRHEPAATGLARRLRDRHVCVCVGAGGVGKTTVSAALALALARRGRRVVLVTIDPARALARALGGGAPPAEAATTGEACREHHAGAVRRVSARGSTPGAGRRGEVPEEHGELWAITLDVAATFDRLLAELEPDPQRRAEVRGNRIYRELAASVAGSHEVAAVAKLFELERDRRFDAIVLDTPPSRDALDFLDAPARLAAFLESRAIGMFLAAAGLGERRGGASGRGAGRLLGQSLATRVVGGGTWLLLSLFARATGAEVIGELAAFFRLLAGLSAALRARARSVDALLRDDRTTFLVVTSPEPPAAQEARFLHRALCEREMPYGGLVVNRVRGEGLDVEPDAGSLEAAAAALGPRLSRRLAESLAELEQLAGHDRRNIDLLARALPEHPPICLPELGGEIDERTGLEALARVLS
jgi:anion-transporting  ArsA/GET3 family ATPase